MTKRPRGIVVMLPVAVLASLFARPVSAGADMTGRSLAGACASCHDPGGHDPGGRDTGVPSIMGWEERRMVTTMLAYRSGERDSQIMHVVAAALSDDEIAAVARYLAQHLPAAGER